MGYFKIVRVKKGCMAAVAASLILLCGGAASALKTQDPEERKSLPIIMYHSVVKNESEEGEYVISTQTLESDIEYILGEGYTPILCSEAADYVKGKGDLPEKPIVLSFDDGCFNNFLYVLPILEKYDVKGVFAVVGEWCMAAGEEASPSPAYSSMDIENVRTLALSGRCEIANHTWDLHDCISRKGVCRSSSEDKEEYRRMLSNDIYSVEKLLGGIDIKLKTYVYPYGFYDKEAEDIVKSFGYDVTLTCEERVNDIAVGDYDCLYGMGRYNRPAGESSKDYFGKIL